MKTVAVIMAGGKGERFWPKSRRSLPKQFLRLVGEQSMLQLTVKRLEKFISIECIYIITSEEYAGLIQIQLPSLPIDNIIFEPVGKNTAPCVGLAAAIIEKNLGSETVMVVLPSDHIIMDEQEFIDVLQTAISAASSPGGPLVTLGITPDGPETAYGYIKVGEKYLDSSNHEVFQVEQFVEKPNRKTAGIYISTGQYLWNSGMFIFQAGSILQEMKHQLPETLEILQHIADFRNKANFEEVIQDQYPHIKPVSIDYGVMEKAQNVLVIPANFGWDDVGSWTSLDRVVSPGQNRNVISGNVVAMDSNDCIIMSETENRMVAVLGASNMIVVDTVDATLICSKEQAQDVKKILDYLKQKRKEQYL